MATIVHRGTDQDVAHIHPAPETPADQTGDRGAEKALHRIVVVGRGAGGLELVTRLGNHLGRRGRASVTLVECARTHIWKPLLHDVAAGSVDPSACVATRTVSALWDALDAVSKAVPPAECGNFIRHAGYFQSA